MNQKSKDESEAGWMREDERGGVGVVGMVGVGDLRQD